MNEQELIKTDLETLVKRLEKVSSAVDKITKPQKIHDLESAIEHIRTAIYKLG